MADKELDQGKRQFLVAATSVTGGVAVGVAGIYPFAASMLPSERAKAAGAPVEATDPMVEAVRTAGEIGARLAFVEPDLGTEPSYRSLHPDPYAVARIGLAPYVAACRERPQPLDFEDKRRAAGIAHALGKLLAETEGEVLAVVGLPLLDAVLAALARPQAQGSLARAVPGNAGRHGGSVLHHHLLRPATQEVLGDRRDRRPLAQDAVAACRRS